MPEAWYIFLLSTSLLALATAGPRILKMNNGVQEKVEQSNSFDYAAMVDTRDELLIGDTALVLDHIDIDVDEFERLKKRIRYLEGAMVKHADRQVVEAGEIKNAEFMLHELDTKVMGPFKEHLVALKAQIMKPHLKYDNQTIAEISTLVRTAELFLQTAQERVDSVEAAEQEWEADEESAKIQEMVVKDHANQKKIFHKKQPKVWVPELKQKLERGGMEEEARAPVGRPGAVFTMAKLDAGKAMKLQKRKNFSLPQAAKEKEKSYYKKLFKEREEGDGNIQLPQATKEREEVYYERMSKEHEEDQVLDKHDFSIKKAQEETYRAEQKALRRVKEELEREAISDTSVKGVERTRDSVQHYSPDVQEALKEAAKASQEFLQHTLTEHKKVEEPAGLPFSLALCVTLVALLSLALGVAVFHKTSQQTRRRLIFQAMAPDCGRQTPCKAGACSSGYMELDETKGDSNWAAMAWSPFKVKSRDNYKQK